MSPAELHRWYDDYLDVCNRHDLAAVRGRLSPAVRRSGRPGGADAWIRDLETLFTAFPDYQWRLVRVVAEGDRIAAHLRARGTHRGAWQGVAATGRPVHVAEFAFYRLDGERIAEFAGAAEDALLMEQLLG